MEHQAPSPNIANKKILIVDDDTAVAAFFGDLLNTRGYLTTIFNDSEAALQHCHSNLDDYSLVISDICMPNLTGDKLAQQIHSINRNIPIILCSGYCDHTNRQTLMEQGIYDFIDKPVNTTKLLKIINELQLGQTN